MGDTLLPSSAVLGGKYVLGDLLGSGAMGLVYRATQPALQRTVAVKVLRPELIRDRRLVRLFQREALAAARVAHPNLVTVLDIGETDDGRPLLVMEYVVGESLGRLARARPLALARIHDIVAQLLAALAAIHRAGIVHADVKSDNVLVETLRDGRDRIRLLDFGLAHVRGERERPFAADDPDRADDGERYVSGTPEYLAPEVIGGEAPTPAADLYSVGVILYELLTGTTPFGDGTALEILSAHLADPVVPPSVRRPDRRIPRALERVVLRALAKHPAERYRSADELLAALAEVAGRDVVSLPCPACGAPLGPDVGYCIACSEATARAAAASGADVSTLAWAASELPAAPAPRRPAVAGAGPEPARPLRARAAAA